MMSMAELEAMMEMWGLARGIGETDEHLRVRIRSMLQWPRYQNNQYMRLCYLLYKLGIQSASRDLPVGAL
jgi:hypothetical protein